MKIPIGYSVKSIDKAIKQIEEYQKKLNDIVPTFLRQCAEKVQEIASDKLQFVGLGANVETEILTSWEIDDSNKTKVILKNNSQKATYVEFGVGQVGAENPHELSGEQGYQYNMASSHKWSNPYSGETQWYISFKSTEDIDLAETYYEPLTEPKYTKRSRKYIRTSGQPATMFLFNALQDFIDEEMYIDIAKQLLKGL